jgi:hypothetical protein
MTALFWIPALFAALALLFSTLALLGGAAHPARRARVRVAAVFAAVSVFLFVYL